jgi:hypothetical protein
MQQELERFVASLAIPADRKAVVLAELSDHAASASETAVREGRDPDAAARCAIGDLETLRRMLEAIEPAFRTTRLGAFARGVIAAALVAILLDQGGTIARGAFGVIAALAVAAACAPPRVLDVLRAELRAPRVRGTVRATTGVPIGPALTYAYTILATPFVVWIGLIVARALRGATTLDVPASAFALAVAVQGILLVEGIRARRGAKT